MGKIFNDLTYNPYVSQYVPLPVNELLTVGTALQERANTAYAAQESGKNFLRDLPVWRNDVADRDTYVTDVQDQFSKLLDQHEGAWESMEFARESNSLINRLTRDPKVKKWQENYSAIQSAQAEADKLGALGLNFNPWENFKTLDDKGSLKTFTGDVQQRLDWDARKETLFNQMEADAKAIGLTDAEFGMLKYGKTKGISKDKVNRYLNEAFKRYATTSEFSQEHRKNVLLGGMTEDQSLQTIKQSLLATGYEKVFKETDYDYTQKPEDDTKSGYEDYSDVRVEDSPFEQVEYNTPIDPDVLLNLDNLSTPTAKNGITASGSNTPQYKYGQPVANTSSLLTEQQRVTFDKISSLFPDAKTDTEKRLAVGNYLKQIKEKKVSTSYYAYNPERADEETKYFDYNYGARLFLDPSTGEVMDGTDFKTKVVDNLPEGEQKIKAVGEYGVDNFYVDITGNDKFAIPVTIKAGNKYYVATADQTRLAAAGNRAAVVNKLTASRRTDGPVKVNELENDKVKNIISFYNSNTKQFEVSLEINGDKGVLKHSDPNKLYGLLAEPDKLSQLLKQ